MLKTTDSIKKFIEWCKENKVKSFKHGDIEFELSELSFLPETDHYKEIPLDDKSTMSDSDEMTQEERDELLFWSSDKSPGKGL